MDILLLRLHGTAKPVLLHALAVCAVLLVAGEACARSFQYNAANRLTRVEYAGGQTIDYTYLNDGSVTSITISADPAETPMPPRSFIVSIAELLMAAFDALDSDNSGDLSLAEVHAAYPTLTNAQLAQLSGGDGSVQLEDLQIIVTVHRVDISQYLLYIVVMAWPAYNMQCCLQAFAP